MPDSDKLLLNEVSKLGESLVKMQEEQAKHNIYVQRKLKRVQANVDVIASAYRDQQQKITSVETAQLREFASLNLRVEARDKRISSMEKKLSIESKEDTDRVVEYWRFVSDSKSMYEGVKTGVDALKQSVQEMKVAVADMSGKMVTQQSCDTFRESCKELRSRGKVWYDFIPLIVSAVTLLALVGGAFAWIAQGPAAIDPETAKSIKILIKKSNTFAVKPDASLVPLK